LLRPAPRPAVTARGVLIGSVGVALTAAAVPFNDYAVNNSFLIGSYLPVVVVLFMVPLVAVVNALLHRFTPAHALRPGELAVVLLMLLVGCSIPAQGLMRAFVPMLVAPFYWGQSDGDFWAAFTKLGLPEWLFPVDNIANGRSSDVVNWFYARVPDGSAAPYGAWVRPLLCWGVFLASQMCVLVSLAVIVREQWARNERLTFPLAQLQIDLIEAPDKGRCFNQLFSSRGFWIAAGVVVVVHSMTALNGYFPKEVPAIPTSYDFRGLFANPPWSLLDPRFKANQFYFMFIGVMYFVPSRVAFSIWFSFLVIQATTVQHSVAFGSDLPTAAWADQNFGAAIAWALGLIWLGRNHWAMVVRHLIGRRRPDETVSYRAPAIALLLGLAGMGGWLLLLGVSLPMTLLAVTTLLLAHLVIARVVAETGLPIIRANFGANQLWGLMPATSLPARDVFFAGVTNTLSAYTTRESLLTFSMHGLRVTDEAEERPPARWKLLTAVAWALLLGTTVSVSASLFTYYRYAAPLTSTTTDTILNKHGSYDTPKLNLVDPLTQHARGQFPPRRHSTPTHLAIGAAVMGTLQVLSARLAWWPLAPVGYLVATSAFIGWIWNSVFVGWLAKVLVVRFGGVKLYRAAKPVFIGLIFGEAMATGIWICVNVGLVLTNHDYNPIRFLPT
jgi:hypothetical protein